MKIQDKWLTIQNSCDNIDSQIERHSGMPVPMMLTSRSNEYLVNHSVILECLAPALAGEQQSFSDWLCLVIDSQESPSFFLPNKKSRTTWNVARLTTHKPNRRRVCHAQFYDQLDGKPIDFSRGMDSL